MSIKSRPYSSEKVRNEFDRIFKTTNYKDVSEFTDGLPTKRDHGDRFDIIDAERGVKVDKISDYQKNQMYAEAKYLKERIKSRLLSRTEAWTPTNENVDKMLKNEDSKEHRKEWEKYRNTMRLLGADPTERDIDRLRPRR